MSDVPDRSVEIKYFSKECETGSRGLEPFFERVPHTNVCTIQPPAGQPRRGKRLRMCSCPRISGEVVYRSVDGRLHGPRFWWGACSTAAGPHLKVLRRWHLQGNEP